VGELGAFLKIDRLASVQRDPRERVSDYREFVTPVADAELQAQGARCMDCGVPFCHNGCPLGNLIPDWNDLVYRGRWKEAIAQLHATNNFPDFTGRVCPAPCEPACVMEIREGEAVTIKQIEHGIIDRAWKEGWVKPQPPRIETGHRVAVIGSGPAGLAAAQQLRRAGHGVVIFERDEAPGGLLRFGIPDFKIEKTVVQRRVQQLIDEGVELRCGVDVGRDGPVTDLLKGFDATVLATGSRVPRDLPVEGRDLGGIHLAMDYLYQRNRWVAGQQGPEPTMPAPPRPSERINASEKHVVVIGGGDTGADCVGNALREGAASVTQLELLPLPPPQRPDDRTPWPLWPDKFRLSYAMQEARELGRGEQDYSIATTHFIGAAGAVSGLCFSRAESTVPFAPVAGTERELRADLVLLAMGFLHPEPQLLDDLGVAKDPRGNVKTTPPYSTSVEGVFAAGDAHRGQSLIVWAINEGRQCARIVDRYLTGRSYNEPVRTGNVEPADEGPEGPPEHVSYGITTRD
jgi:glutamate synthase (NADPH/NADH) small chain